MPYFGNLDLAKYGAVNPNIYAEVGAVSPFFSGSSAATPPLPLDLASKNLTSALHGELPPDVQNLLAQRAAEIGVASGTGGSEFNKFRSLRDLGLTSIGRQDEATKMLMSQFTTPYQSASLGLAYTQEANRASEANQRRAPQGPFFSQPGGGWGNTPTGEVSAPLYQPGGGGGGGASRFMAPMGVSDPMASTHQVVQDLFTKYMGGGGGGGGGSAPMGGIPNYAGSWASQPPASEDMSAMIPGGYASGIGLAQMGPSAQDFETLQLQQLAELGVADPSWGAPAQDSYASFTPQEQADYAMRY